MYTTDTGTFVSHGAVIPVKGASLSSVPLSSVPQASVSCERIQEGNGIYF